MQSKKYLEYIVMCDEQKTCEECTVQCAGVEDIFKQAEELAKEAQTYREMLERLEWSVIASWGNNLRCPNCYELKTNGHKPGCELVELLKESEDK